MIRTLFWLLDELLSLYIWAVILAAVFSMLASFGVLDTRNRIVWTIGDFLYRLTEPALRPIRNFLPSFGNIDLSPLILLLLLVLFLPLLILLLGLVGVGRISLRMRREGDSHPHRQHHREAHPEGGRSHDKSPSRLRANQGAGRSACFETPAFQAGCSGEAGLQG